jgi:hypothetical protein
MKILAVIIFICVSNIQVCRANTASADPATLFYEGLLVLKNNTQDTIKGFIQMGSSKYGKNFIVLRTDTGTRAVEKTQISFIRLFYKSGPDSLRKFTDFKPINFQKNLIWRLLGSGKADVYDNQLSPETVRYYLGNSLGELSGVNIYDLVVAGSAGMERIPASSINWGVPKKRNHFILKYINKRYSTHFKKSDFPSNAEMIRYIVDHG